ncbi:protein phosphatase CheZ [Thauera propionica]|uniref:Protein phosphatase CheZ n=3 Tax=Thauera TaxID=33057 RepID=A0A235EX17_9RHOO|nr:MULTISPECIES: protein phosphatase CheZ [Thauera]MDD3675725.1 protein phosphatase CheZ [Thauera propionica]MDI3490540.1 chemotaxis protein CheZ [Thauera sp.]OYD53588.1 protein phosphatase CheZ [Thauera propionica]
MSKRAKIDESGDSDDLQALFDSIASEPAAVPTPAAKPAPTVAAPSADGSGDNDELQALFDAVAEETGAAASVSAPTDAPAAAPAEGEAVFNRLGQMTRQLHDALRELGLNEALQDFAEAMPDARQRLDYIAQMTEQAASRVLNATDIARPLQDGLQNGAGALRGRWDQLFAGQLSPDEFRQLSVETRDFLGTVDNNSRATNAQLLEIMMAQDFQDLTGQVIKRVVDLAQTLESQLLQVLLETAPPTVKLERKSSLMNGPVIDGKRPDVVTTQAQVDDLLESLGF